MANTRAALPVRSGMLRRCRLDALFEKALDHLMVTVTAGPGYGKTQAVAAFMRQVPGRLVWMHMMRLDNNPDRFWYDFIRALVMELPGLASRLKPLGFPATPEKYDAFLRTFTRELYAGESIVMVLDDYSNIRQIQVRRFFQNLLDAELENFSLWLICNEKNDVNAGGIKRGGSIFSISANDLRFTNGEAAAFLKMRGLPCGVQEAEALVAGTDGWPFALGRLESWHLQPGQAQGLPLDLVGELFENEYYAGYNEGLQRLLIKLAQFPAFSLGLVRALCGEDTEAMLDGLVRNAFIFYDYPTNQFVFQKMYRAFLQTKQSLLSPQQLMGTWRAAGQWFLHNGQPQQAIDWLYRGQDYDGMVQAVLAVPLRHSTVNTSNRILDYLRQIPPDWRREHPEVEFLISAMHLSALGVTVARAGLEQLAERLEALPETPDRNQLLGEAYAFLADICLLRNEDCFCELFKKAARLMPQGSRYRIRLQNYLGNNPSFFLPSGQPGALQHTLALHFEAAPYAEQISHTYGCGYELLYAAEAAMNLCEMEQAKDYSFRCIYKASEREQFDLVCNAWLVLLRVYIFYGDLDAVQNCLRQVEALVESHPDHEGLQELKDSIDCWFYVKIGDLDKVPLWMKGKGYLASVQLPLEVGRNAVVFACYLAVSGRHEEAMAVFDKIEQVHQQKRIWTTHVFANLLRAVGWVRQPATLKKGLEAFRTAYDMCWQNGVMMPFVEFGNLMRTMVELVRREDGAYYDDDFLENIYLKASSYAKRFATLVAAYNLAQRTGNSPTPVLTRREKEVLAHLAQGMTREEIAELMHITVNGIKKHITGIYNKLGAVNRADAIRIATLYGFLQ